MSVPRANSTEMEAVPVPFCSSEVEVTFSTPRTCWIAASSGEVRNASVASGEAPGQEAFTVSRGSSVSGSSSMGTSTQAATPSRETARYAMATAMGRRMEKRITSGAARGRGRGHRPCPPAPGFSSGYRRTWSTSSSSFQAPST